MKLTKRDIPSEILEAFPNYKGRKFSVEPALKVSFHDLHWGGGTRNQYRLVRLLDGARAPLDIGSAPWTSAMEGATVPMVPGYAVVQHSIFCGKDIGLTVIVHPDDCARLIGEEAGS